MLVRKRAGEVRVDGDIIAEAWCEGCGVLNHHPNPDTGTTVVITIAHVNRDRTINQFWNLRAWCQRCHLNHDRAVHIYNRMYGRETKYVNGKLF